MADALTPEQIASKRAQDLVDSLWNDKTVGASVRAKAKELYPDVVIPEDTFDPIMAPMRDQMNALKADLDKEREERAAEKKEREEASQRVSMESMLDAARNRFNLTDDGFDKMVTRMKETGNYQDAEAAAAWVAQQQPAPQVNNKADFLPKRLDFFANSGDDEGAEDFKLLHRDPIAYMDKSLNDFVADPEKYIRETLAA